MWIFGYGSLVWRPAFDFEEQQPAYLVGWKRRFWQASTDHRGTPSRPGRVVTLVAAAEEQCWGMAYRVSAEGESTVMSNLDHRERQGYERVEAQLHGLHFSAKTMATFYVASKSNPQFTGPSRLSAIAAIIRESAGPSGSNVEYVLQLHKALQAIGARDSHVSELAALLGDDELC